jgi:hypothetical protein
MLVEELQANEFLLHRAKTYVEKLTGEKVTAKH